jgi:hypothetical protein
VAGAWNCPTAKAGEKVVGGLPKPNVCFGSYLNVRGKGGLPNPTLYTIGRVVSLPYSWWSW